MLPCTFNDVLAALGRRDAGITFGARQPTHVTYAELSKLVRGNAAHFAAQGLRRGDRVAIALDSNLEHVVAFLALMALGALPVSVKPRRGSVETYGRTVQRLLARHRIHRAYATLGVPVPTPVVSWDPAPTSPGFVADVLPSDIAFVQFSSGSLGDPKPIPIRHENLVHNIAAIFEVDHRTPETKGVNFLPLSHDMGLVGGLLSNLVLENPLRLASVGDFLRRPLEVLAGGTGTAMPDFAMRTLVRRMQTARDGAGTLHGLRTIYCGAEPISARTVRAFLEVAVPRGLDPSALVFAYGLAEATLMVTARRFDARSFSNDTRPVANLGTPRRGTEVAIRDDGHVLVRGPGVVDGYLDDVPRDSAWLDTGDLGRLDGGDLAIVGRAKELVIVNGENLFPADIEETLAGVPGVGEPLVMGEDDRFYVYVVRDGHTPPPAQDLASLVAAEFGAAPTAIAFGSADAVLRTTSGKPMRAATLAALRDHGVLARPKETLG